MNKMVLSLQQTEKLSLTNKSISFMEWTEVKARENNDLITSKVRSVTTTVIGYGLVNWGILLFERAFDLFLTCF